jgi:hypothetical protein
LRIAARSSSKDFAEEKFGTFLARADCFCANIFIDEPKNAAHEVRSIQQPLKFKKRLDCATYQT